MKRVYVHVDPAMIADELGNPIRVWNVDTGAVSPACRVELHGPAVVVHDPAGVVDPEGRGIRVWVETHGPVTAFTA